jgi:hypothetical protein
MRRRVLLYGAEKPDIRGFFKIKQTGRAGRERGSRVLREEKTT